MTYPDGSVYRGEFKDDLPHGEGVLVSSDGSRYEGEFRFGARDGKGTFTQKDGRVFKGIFKKDELIKREF